MLCSILGGAGTVVQETEAQPGLVLRVRSLDGDVVDHRVTRMAALAVPAGESPSPFLDPGPFEATFDGFLRIDVLDDYEFNAAGRGSLEVKFGNEIWTQSPTGDLTQAPPFLVELDQGLHPVRVRYVAPSTGDAWFRLSWASFDFTAEPVPPDVWRHDPASAGLRRSLERREVREWVAMSRCDACHDRGAGALGEAGVRMPELDEVAPPLTSIGARVRPSWLARWIDDPTHWRHDASMPRMFHSGSTDVDSRSIDVAAYLMSAEDGEDDADSGGNVDQGRDLFQDLGCLACHLTTDERGNPPDAQVLADTDRLSLHRIAAKWKANGLVEYLRDPRRFQPNSGMPDFRLTDEEAWHLVAFLMDRSTAGPGAVSFANASPERGRALLQSSGCLACHEHGDDRNTADRVPLSALDPTALTRGCLSDAPATGSTKVAPDHGWNPEQLTRLRAHLHATLPSMSRRSSIEYAERQITRRRCLHCHESDGELDVWRRHHGDDAAASSVAQMRPPLTWAGEKLLHDWIAQLVEGKAASMSRPWLSARMPGFGVEGATLASGMALRHGRLPDGSRTEDGAPDPQRLAAGERLLSTNRGMACVTCHDLGDQKATAVFDSRGPDLLGFPVRMHRDFYVRWMMQPLRYTPGTKMPGFAEDGLSPFTDVLGGDAREQFLAMWEFLVAKHEESR